MKEIIKWLFFKIGLMRIFHQFRNKKTLTIIMLHRVLPDKQALEQGADLEWTISPELLDSIIVFAKKYYNFISLQQLQSWQSGQGILPDRALLLTFDDGWADNYGYALPIVKLHKVPAVIHQVSDCIDNHAFLWQEQLTILAKLDLLLFDELLTKLELKVNSLSEAIFEIENNVEKRNNLIKLLPTLFPLAQKMMLNSDELIKMQSQGFSLSSHGKTHSKLSLLSQSELQKELSESKKSLEKICKQKVTSISFPHGGVNTQVIQESICAGYQTLFSSQSIINLLVDGKKLFGRIHLSAENCKENNCFSSKKLSFFLFYRTKKTEVDMQCMK
ncbi:hypothetical protein CMT41_18210 [Colwellia sp. MT41]|uniref:polysaccharide deacetylase family protein n=1 Tax=Colwellia sp. MT41 TaxID=58049 RepID=UPI0007178805|nr:polysaccharide deacetylase family protein [Colwellia sp. MT41]ALO36459.1 hypothetical protein CMT41_18210 [Colwellia sp. MT41]